MITAPVILLSLALVAFFVGVAVGHGEGQLICVGGLACLVSAGVWHSVDRERARKAKRAAARARR